uniref:RAB, member of RAS oncogene family-like 3 n=1 Tax=Oryzias sinensis TaxID=183150 RepID=A0A8C8DL28_9TELE
MASLDRVKVLVLGDSGVGKSSLVHLLCQNQVLGNPSWTVGCSVDVRINLVLLFSFLVSFDVQLRCFMKVFQPNNVKLLSKQM